MKSKNDLTSANHATNDSTSREQPANDNLGSIDAHADTIRTPWGNRSNEPLSREPSTPTVSSSVSPLAYNIMPMSIAVSQEGNISISNSGRLISSHSQSNDNLTLNNILEWSSSQRYHLNEIDGISSASTSVANIREIRFRQSLPAIIEEALGIVNVSSLIISSLYNDSTISNGTNGLGQSRYLQQQRISVNHPPGTENNNDSSKNNESDPSAAAPQ